MTKTVLITGWLGYIWSHTVVALYEAGYKCIVIDNLANTTLAVADNIEKLIWEKLPVVVGDVRDMTVLDSVFLQHTINGVIHFSALKAVGESCEKPVTYFDNNIVWLISVLKAMEKHNVKKIIFSSSATVYDAQATDAPYSESAPCKTINPYGKTKRVAELLLQDIAEFAKAQVIALRYFNPIGAHKSGLLWENPKGIPNNLLPYLFRVANGEYPVLKVFGNDYDTPDGTCLRDYIHVVDLANAHLAAYTYLENTTAPGWLFQSINIGTGKPTSVLDIIKATEQTTGNPLPYDFAPRRPWDAMSVYSDPSLAKKLLNREAHYDIQEAIADGWQFVKGIGK